MSDTNSSNGNDWFWSQRGATLGPVDFTEIRRLVGNGSIARDTWVFDPAQGAWGEQIGIGRRGQGRGQTGDAIELPPRPTPLAQDLTVAGIGGEPV